MAQIYGRDNSLFVRWSSLTLPAPTAAETRNAHFFALLRSAFCTVSERCKQNESLHADCSEALSLPLCE